MIKVMEPNLLNLNNEDSVNTTNFSLKGKKIFIVEDDVFLGDILSKRIASETTDLTLFKNGEDALLALDKNIPDIILLDILLPGMNGFQVLEKIRNNNKTKNIPVLIVSNTSQSTDREKAKNLNAEFLMKALVTPYEIIDKVKQMLFYFK